MLVDTDPQGSLTAWYASEEGKQIYLSMEYSTKLFKRDTIIKFMNHFVNIAREIIANPENKLANIEMISDAERQQILYEFNDTEINYNREKYVIQLFEEQVLKTPQNVAVVSQDKELTYDELNLRANQLAHKLRAQGVKAEKIVGILVERSVEMVIAILAVLRARGAYLPIDPDYPQERVKYILEDSGADILLTTFQKGKFLSSIGGGISNEFCQNFTEGSNPLLKSLNSRGNNEVLYLDDDALYQGDSSNLQLTGNPDDLAYIIYTSGSTGKPKGVMVEQRNLLNYINAFLHEFKLDQSDVVLSQASYSFDAFVEELYPVLLSGGKLVIAEKYEVTDLNILKEILLKHHVTLISCSPLLLNELNNLALLPSIHTLISGGDILRSEYITNLVSQAQVYNTYGPTEGTVCATYYRIDDKVIKRSIPIGKPIANYRVYIMDEKSNLLPIGVPGELYISGVGVTRGYLNRPQLTVDKFIQDPFFAGERIYRTGDLARWLPDGNVEFLGRIDSQVKIRGYRIEPGEIEKILVSHDAIDEALVIARDRQDGEKYLCAYIILKDELSVTELRDYLIKDLPGYMINSSYFIKLDKFQLTPNGKIDQRALPEPDASIETDREYEAPRNELEEKLAKIWSQILGLKRVGINDNFFVIGGHSLKATALLAEVEKELNLKLPLREIFKSVTIKAQAVYLQGSAKVDYTAISKVAESEYYPVSSAQKRMYILNQLDPKSTNYNLSSAMFIEGELDLKRLADALETLVVRHESFRTAFRVQDGEVVQQVYQDVSFNIEKVKAKEADLEEIVKEFIRPFDLSKAPLLRAKLVDLSEKHLLIIDTHHIVSDGFSIDILINEFLNLYQGNSLPELRIQYKDYANWQNELFKSDEIKREEEYWLNVFNTKESMIPTLNMPTDFKRSAVRDFAGNIIEFRVDTELTYKLNSIAQKNGATLFMFLMAAYNILLAKYSGQEDIIIGTPIAGRPHADLNNVIGMFVNTLAMRNYPTNDKTFVEFLIEVKENALKAYENQNYQFEMLVEKLDLDRDMSRNPLFDVVFALQNMQHMERVEHGLRFVPYDFAEQNATFDLTIYAFETSNGLNFSLQYATSLFKEETIERLIEHFINIMRSVVQHPECSILELEMISAAEKEQLLYKFNDTVVDYPMEKTINQLFSEQVERTPDNLALVYADQRLSYLELDEKINQLARVLRGYGVGRESIVGIFADKSIEMIIGVLAIVKAGGAYMPIDVAYPESRIEFMLNDSETKILLTRTGQSDKISHFDGKILYLDNDRHYSGESSNLEDINNYNDLIYIIYTSGSTGNPKGVMIEHYNVNRLITNSKELVIDENERFLQTCSLAFDVSTFDIWGPFLNGAVLYLIDKDEVLSTTKLAKRIEEYQITSMFLTTPLFIQLVEDDPAFVDALKTLYFGGDVVSPKQVNIVRARNKDLNLVNCYGPTECTTFATCFPIVSEWEENVPIGKPISNTTAYILDKYGKIQPIGVPGELCLGGDGLARGYLNRLDLTAEKFILNPYIVNSTLEERIYKTGDLARWLPDGNIEFLGRIDNQIKIRGFRVELGEIESLLLKNEAIKEAVVIVRQNGVEDKQLALYYVAKTELSTEELREHLAKDLPEYMIPTYFTQLERLPLTPNGKIDRNALLDITEMSSKEREYVAPTKLIEERLVQIWSEVLGVKQIGVTDNFFELGGHSLKATLVVSKIFKELNVDLQLSQIFKMPTIRKLAQYLEEAEQTLYSAIEPTNEQEYYPVSSAQKRMYILNQMSVESTSYNMPGMVFIEGELNRERFADAINALIARHESFRTSFELINGEPMQKINVVQDFEIVYKEATEAGLKEIMNDFIYPFDLSKAPLLRLGLVHITDSSEQRHLLMFDMHHIISDGASMSILINDFLSLYNGEGLSPLRIQYKDFAIWQNELFASDTIKKQEEYWLERFAGEISVLNLPTDQSPTGVGGRPADIDFKGDTFDFAVDLNLTNKLNDLAYQNGATLYMVLLAAYNVLLAKYAGQEDIIVGSPIAGRPHPDLENIIGMFVNTLALRNYPERQKSFAQFLTEVKENALKAYENQDYQFEMLVEKLEIQRSLSRNALFDTMFVLQNGGNVQKTINDLTLIPYQYESKIAKFDLTTNAVETSKGIGISIEYRTSLFVRETIERMARHFVNVLNEITQSPEIKINAIDLLSTKEKDQLIREFNHNLLEYPKDKTLHQLFEEQVAKTPKNIALIQDDKHLTYCELNARANRLAGVLRSKGVKPDQIVGIFAEPSFEMIIGILGILKAGGAYLPLVKKYPKERLEYMLKDGDVSILFCQKDFVNQIEFMGEIVYFEDGDLVKEELSELSNLPNVNRPGDLAYIIYTSGTTGNPKGVMVEHRGVVNTVNWRRTELEFGTEDRILQVFSFAFDGFVASFFTPIVSGARVILVTEEEMLDPISVKNCIRTHLITHFICVPSLYSTLLECISKEEAQSLRLVSLGGEKVTTKILEKSEKLSSDITIVNEYGPTENSVVSTFCAGLKSDERITIGRPIPNTEVYIVDEELQLVPIGVPGEICVGGVGLARGYLNRPDLTKEKFVPTPFNPDTMIYRTGDLGRWLSNGQIEFIGRKDYQVKIRGYRIELGEIENQLLKHSAIKEVVVLDHEDNENTKYLTAYFVSDQKLQLNHLREELSEVLPEYMIPAYFMQLEELPLTSNGKINRKALPKLDLSKNEREYVAPRNRIEEKLAEIWSGILNIDRIGIEDNFFELGGHSLKATTMVGRVFKELNLILPLREVFKTPTIKGIAKYLQKGVEGKYSAIEPVKEQDYYPVSSAQKRMFLLNRIEGLSINYNMPEAYIISGELDLERFEIAFKALVMRHEALRTSFELINDEPMQIIHSAVEFEIQYFEATEEEFPTITKDFIKPFDLKVAPLLRVGLVEIADKVNQYLLIVDLHHIISDGTSRSILISEFSRLYAGEELSPLRIQYKDFAVWQNQFFKSEEMVKEEEFWLNIFKENTSQIPVLEMPTDYPRSAERSFTGEEISFDLNKELTDGLNELARQHEATIYMVLLVSYNILLSKYTGQEDIIIGSPIAGRVHIDLENIIGMFVNTLVMRNYPEGEKTFNQFLDEVKENALKVYENQDYPFE